jgi:YHS domain-containing protein
MMRTGLDGQSWAEAASETSDNSSAAANLGMRNSSLDRRYDKQQPIPRGGIMRNILAFLCAMLLGAPAAWAANDKNTISDGGDERLMMRGKDPVSYFTGPAPVAGNPAIKAEHDGVTYRFASEENKRTFLASPEKFVPKYGGHCSNGMVYAIGGSHGETHRIIDGKLHLFGGERSRNYFEMDLEKNRKLADHYWETEYKGKDWREVSGKRSSWRGRVEHYKTNRELANEYEAYLEKKKAE